MARLVVYGRSAFCPDMHRWRQWVDEHPLQYIEFDIDHDDRAHDKVLARQNLQFVGIGNLRPSLLVSGSGPTQLPLPA